MSNAITYTETAAPPRRHGAGVAGAQIRRVSILMCLMCLICLFGVSLSRADPSDSLKRFEYRQVHMGLQVRLLLYAPDEDVAFRAASSAFAEIARLDAIMSDYRGDSELMGLVARAGTGPVVISRDLFEVLQEAQLLAARSGGAFDVTISPLVRLWREARASAVLPSRSRIDSALTLTGFRKLRLNAPARPDSAYTAELAAPGMQLDLGGIGKGFAADRALAVLEEAGVDRALIEFGGDVRAGAPPPGETGWRVRVAHADSAHRHIDLAHAAVASSGDTEQFVEIDGVRYSHVVDPATGLGLTTRIAATVVAPNGTVADALATTLTVLGPERGEALLQEHYPEATGYVRYVNESAMVRSIIEDRRLNIED